ncbi:MAG: hypothetical protein RL161_1066 [Bacteroidota bacterium]|jgi:putative membrane protein
MTKGSPFDRGILTIFVGFPRIMSDNQRFSDNELNRIREAVNQAEKNISGEIVPVFVERSGHYTVANYRGVVIGSLLFFVLIILFDRFFPQWAVYDPLLIMLIVSLGGILGAVLPQFLPWLKRTLITRDQLEHTTKQRAETAFLQEEVFNTRHRTGIMLFVSFFEHEVIVMADRGISKVVEQKEWDNLVAIITKGISSGDVVGGMEAAIRRCGEILTEQGFTKTHDDINELPDDLRVN